MYLRHAVAALQVHQLVRERGVDEEIYESASAVQLMLNTLLRNELQNRLLSLLDDPPFAINVYDYTGPELGLPSREHVVPLGQIIKLLTAQPQYGGTVASLKALLSRCLVVASVPSGLNEKLRGALRWSFPSHAADKWYLEASPDFTEDARQDALWSRYISIGEVRPGRPGSNFQLRLQR
jgi:hypothetical protein